MENINLENVNLNKINSLRYTSNAGDKILVFEDGRLEVLGTGSWLKTETWYGVIPCIGKGNIDYSVMAEGWAEEQEDGTYKDMYDLSWEAMTADEMILEALEEGDFTEEKEWIAEELERQFEEEK